MLSPRSVVLIDDDVDDREIFCVACAQVDVSVKVVCFESGDQALQALSQKQTVPQIIFLDLNMPRRNGLEVLRELKCHETLKSIPVIIYTTSFDSHVRMRCHALGAVDIIEKPNNFEILCGKLRSLLNTPA